MPEGRIAIGRLRFNEQLVFRYQARIKYTARARSGLVRNTDEYSAEFPCYFVVDRATLRPADKSVQQLELEYNNATKETKHFGGQGWNIARDNDRVWAWLGGAPQIPEEATEPADADYREGIN